MESKDKKLIKNCKSILMSMDFSNFIKKLLNFQRLFPKNNSIKINLTTSLKIQRNVKRYLTILKDWMSYNRKRLLIEIFCISIKKWCSFSFKKMKTSNKQNFSQPFWKKMSYFLFVQCLWCKINLKVNNKIVRAKFFFQLLLRKFF